MTSIIPQENLLHPEITSKWDWVSERKEEGIGGHKKKKNDQGSTDIQPIICQKVDNQRAAIKSSVSPPAAPVFWTASSGYTTVLPALQMDSSTTSDTWSVFSVKGRS